MSRGRGLERVFVGTSEVKRKAKVWLSVLFAMAVLVSVFAVFAGAEPEGNQGQGTNNEVPTHTADECALPKDTTFVVHKSAPKEEAVEVTRNRSSVVDNFSPLNGASADIDFTKYIKDVKVQINNGDKLYGPRDTIPKLTTSDKVTFWFYYSLCGRELDVNNDTVITDKSTWVHYSGKNYTYIDPRGIMDKALGNKYKRNEYMPGIFTIPADSDYILDDTQIATLYNKADTEGHLYMNAGWIEEIVADKDFKINIESPIFVQYPAVKQSAEDQIDAQSENADKIYFWFPDEYDDKAGNHHVVDKEPIAIDGEFNFSVHLNVGEHTVDIFKDIDGKDIDGFYGDPGPFDFDVEESKEQEGTHHYTGLVHVAKKWEEYTAHSDDEKTVSFRINKTFTDGRQNTIIKNVEVDEQDPLNPFSFNIEPGVDSWTIEEVVGVSNFICTSVEETLVPVPGAGSGIPKIIFTNSEKATLSISKKAIGGKEELPGAEMALYEVTKDSEGKEKLTQRSDDWNWTSSKDDTPHVIDDIVPGEYILTEVAAPDGYFTISNKIGFTVDSNYKIIPKTGDGYAQSKEYAFSGTAKDGFMLTVYDNYTRVKIEKREASATDKAGDLLNGAKLALYNNAECTGDPLYQWTTDANNNPYSIEHLAPGTYYLKEIEAPAGYLMANVKEITIAATTDEQTFTMVDDLTKVEITKKDEAGNPVKNAQLELRYSEGEHKGEVVTLKGVKLAWNTKDENPKTLVGLPVGSYTLVETKAPNGYQKAANVTITVTGKADGNGNAVVEQFSMIDKITELQIVKTDENNKPLPGADLELRYDGGDKNDQVVSLNGTELKWTTDGTPHLIQGLENGKYKIVETKAPEGYLIGAEKSFTVTSELKDPENQIYTITYANSKTKAEFTKVDENGDPLSGAELVIRDDKGNKVGDSWTTDGTVHTVYGMKKGSYKLVELKAPNGYAIADPVPFEITDTDAEPVKVEMQDKLNQIQLAKVDEADKFLSGAGLGLRDADGKKVQDKNGNVVADWTSKNGKEAWHTVSGLLDGTYYLVETTVPKGYLQAEPVEIVVKNGGFFVDSKAVIKVKMTDKLNKIDFAKVDEKNAPIAGASLAVQNAKGEIAKDKDGNELSWTTSAAEQYHTVYGLPAGTYKLVEVKNPAGYMKAAPVEFVVTDKANTTVTLVSMTDKITKVQFAKVDMSGKNYVPGASLEVRKTDKADGEIVMDKDGKKLSWTSGNQAVTFTGIPAGTYYLIETKAPKGYATAAPVKFTIPEMAAEEDQTVVVTMKDAALKLDISKQDITNSKELPGAKLEIKDSTGKVIDSWVSTDKPHRVDMSKLNAGESYTLIETTAPDGYIKAEEITFTVEDTGKVQTVTMEDDTLKVYISKQDITGGKELPGAKLEIKDSTGKVIDSWTSTDKPHYVDKSKLVAGKSYTLTETSAPAGYAIAETIQFTVKSTGEIQTVVMKDDITKVYISKQDIAGEEVPGAKLEIKDSTGKVVASWTSTDKPHYIEMLPAGDYTLTETMAPAGYVTAESLDFTVTATGEIQSYIMVDDVTKVEVSKKDITNGEELPGAKLEIKDSTGKVVASWVSTDKPHYIEKLPVGEYTLTEITAPDGYVTAETITFKVEDSGEIKAVEMFDDITRVEISKKDITNSEELPGATLQIHTKGGDLVEEWVSGDKPHYIEKLPVGDYVLTEISSPDGYGIAENVEFTVKDSGEIQMVEMFDDITKVKISKVDFTTKEELPGATLTLTDIDGNKIDEWVSGKEPHYIEKLNPGKYILTETIAPDGYLTAESITFEVKNGGEILPVVMEDAYTRLIISKKDFTNCVELAGAHLELRDKDDKLVEEWVSTNNPHYIKMLKPGTYTLIEISAPAGYRKAKPITFTLKADGSVQTVTMFDKPVERDEEPTPTPVRPVSPKTADNGSVVEMVCVFGILSALTMAGVCMKRKKEY